MSYTIDGGSIPIFFDPLDRLPIVKPTEGINVLHLYPLNTPAGVATTTYVNNAVAAVPKYTLPDTIATKSYVDQAVGGVNNFVQAIPEYVDNAVAAVPTYTLPDTIATKTYVDDAVAAVPTYTLPDTIATKTYVNDAVAAIPKYTIPDAAVTDTKLAANAVTTLKIADGAITTQKLDITGITPLLSNGTTKDRTNLGTINATGSQPLICTPTVAASGKRATYAVAVLAPNPGSFAAYGTWPIGFVPLMQYTTAAYTCCYEYHFRVSLVKSALSDPVYRVHEVYYMRIVGSSAAGTQFDVINQGDPTLGTCHVYRDGTTDTFGVVVGQTGINFYINAELEIERVA